MYHKVDKWKYGLLVINLRRRLIPIAKIFLPLCVLWNMYNLLDNISMDQEYPAPAGELILNNDFKQGRTYWINFYPAIVPDVYTVQREGLFDRRKNLIMNHPSVYGSNPVGQFQYLDLSKVDFPQFYSLLLSIEAKVSAPTKGSRFYAILEVKCQDGSYKYNNTLEWNMDKSDWSISTMNVLFQKKLEYAMVFLLLEGADASVAIRNVSLRIDQKREWNFQPLPQDTSYIWKTDYQVTPFAVESEREVQVVDVSIVTQMSVDRFDRLKVIAGSWEGDS